jgi:hypothetical protein
MSEYDISNDAILNLAAQLNREETTQFLADRFRALLMDREWLRGERDSARNYAADLLVERQQLRAALERAIDYVDLWSCYAAPVYKEKHDLAGNLRDLQDALKVKEAAA